MKSGGENIRNKKSWASILNKKWWVMGVSWQTWATGSDVKLMQSMQMWGFPWGLPPFSHIWFCETLWSWKLRVWARRFG
jgi:hypothetical protein